MPAGVITLVAAAVLLAAPTAEELREKGTRAYREGRYPEACDLFKRAAQLTPKNGALQSDLGLCMAKIGQLNDAYVASLEAVRFGNARTRKNAYFNLGDSTLLNGFYLDVPSPGPCGEIQSNITDCKQSIHACRSSWESEYDGPDLLRSGEILRVWMGPEAGPPGARDFEMNRVNPTLGYVTIQTPDATPPSDRDRFRFSSTETVVPGTVDILTEHYFHFSGRKKSPEAERLDDLRYEKLPGRVTCRIQALDACRARLGLFCREDKKSGRRWAEEIDLSATRPRPRKNK